MPICPGQSHLTACLNDHTNLLPKPHWLASGISKTEPLAVSTAIEKSKRIIKAICWERRWLLVRMAEWQGRSQKCKDLSRLGSWKSRSTETHLLDRYISSGRKERNRSRPQSRSCIYFLSYLQSKHVMFHDHGEGANETLPAVSCAILLKWLDFSEPGKFLL